MAALDRDTPRHALVTGTSSGIGQAVAARLLTDGWRVTGIARRAPQALEGDYMHLPCDLSDPEALATTVAQAGPVDALVHAAGLLRVGPIETADFNDGAAMWQLHVDVAARLISLCAPDMPEGGRIVLIGSRVARGAAGRALYAASKAALSGLARSVAAEFAPRQITVNIVAPGATDTPMLRDPARASEPPRMPPFGRLVRPEEVAGTTAFLLSPDAGAMTGQELIICAGGSL